MAKKSRSSKASSAVLASKFPLLAASPSISDQMRQELSETENEFARRLRRGKSNRLKELANLERDLEISDLRAKLARLQPIDQLLTETCGNARTLLEAYQSSAPESNPEIIYGFDTLQTHLEPHVLPHVLPNVYEILLDLELDEIGIALFRYLTSIDKSHRTIIGNKKAITRQSVWERSRRLQTKMWELRKLTAIQSLSDSLEHRNRRAGLNGGPSLPISDPFVSLALDTSNGPFPTVFDVVRFGLWIWSARQAEDLLAKMPENTNLPWGVTSSPNPECQVPGFVTPNNFEEFDPGLSRFVKETFEEASK